MNCQLKNKPNCCQSFSLVLDRVAGVNNSAHVLFIKGVNADFEVIEELTSM
jgi:hypothetical protein